MRSSSSSKSSLSENEENENPLDPIAEFERLKLETAEISAKMRASTPLLATNFSNEMLGTVLSELKMMRQEIKEIKEDGTIQKETLCKMEDEQANQKKVLAKIRMEQKNQNEVLSDITENLQKMEENRSMLQERVDVIKSEQENQKEVLSETKTVQENQKEVLNGIMENLKEIGVHQTELQEKVSEIHLERKTHERNFKRELKNKFSELQKEMAENRESVEKIESEQQNQTKLINECKKLQEKITENEKSLEEGQKQTLDEVKNIQEKQTSLEKAISKLKCQPTIRDLIFGKWRDVKDGNDYFFSAKFENETFMIKWNYDDSFVNYTLGVKHKNGITTSVENNTIVLIENSDKGEEHRREVFHFENDKIIQTVIYPDDDNIVYIHERIGDPDPE